MTDVSDVLRDRMQEPGGLQLMAGLSIGLHAVLAAFVILAPATWLRGQVEPAPRVMTITLGGGSGPSNGGMTAAGGRPVQAEGPEPKRFDAVRPPAAKTPEMVLPRKTLTPPKAAAKTPAAVVTQAPDEARGKTPTKGSETTPGTAVAQTAARGQGFGLSTGGGPGAGATVDVADFCCPDYLVLMIERIKTAWNQQQGVAGQVIVKFTIQRDGRLLMPVVERSSGNPALDLAALSAIASTKQIPPLPAAFPNSTLPVHLTFEYAR